MRRFNPEYQVPFIKDALAKDPSLQHEELFKEWASENSSILL